MRRLAAVVVGLVLVAGACAQGDSGDRDLAVPESGQSGSSVTTAAPGTGSDGTASGQASAVPGLDFTAPLVGGGSFDAAEVAGDDLALWFWSPW